MSWVLFCGHRVMWAMCYLEVVAGLRYRDYGGRHVPAPLQLTVKHKLTPKLQSDLEMFSQQKGKENLFLESDLVRFRWLFVFYGLSNQFLNLDFEGELSLGMVAGFIQSLVGRSLTADECREWTDGEVLICKWPPEDSESFFTGDSFPILVLVTYKPSKN